ncbi:hypothetical protein PRIPAC_81807 [Pristionchus pacificus]|uniref:Uncharacterized protein n=1 Tax=Pristionchus pacificus TaxID=54126 RepID=A0A2A6CLI6_PRIPA|nr:hypothetical protein PRIPAC_81807 [Pristionchus pacificus]|eukprot:PDM79062.1 hypothetical protein PRIPAC_31641 [Pristionchus pacificus]
MIKIVDIPLDLSVNGGQVIHQTFSNILPSSQVDDVTNIKEDELKFEYAVPDEINLEVEGRMKKKVKIGEQQKIAIRAGLDLKRAIVNVQSCYGSGKTMTLALLTARAVVHQFANRIVVLTAVTNSGVSQAINSVLQMADFRQDIIPLRFVRDNGAMENPTEADVIRILENLEETDGMEMTLRELSNLREFLDRGKQMLHLTNDNSLVDIPINDQESYKIAETRCSHIVHGIIKTMLRAIHLAFGDVHSFILKDVSDVYVESTKVRHRAHTREPTVVQ